MEHWGEIGQAMVALPKYNFLYNNLFFNQCLVFPGMDNMFIIIDATESIDPNIKGPERLVVAMKHVGGSITMTTSTDLVAFAVSTVSHFPAVHIFCVYAALCIFFAYVLLITLFLALVTADIHRMESGRRDVFPCCKAKILYLNSNPWEKSREKFSKKVE